MKSDSISVEIIENSETELISLSVVRLRSVSSSCVGPVDIVVSPTRGPPDVAIVDLASCPEISLSVLSNQTQEMILLSSGVKTHSNHVVVSTESLSLTLGELGASDSPTDQHISALVLVIGLVSSSSTLVVVLLWSPVVVIVVVVASSAVVVVVSEVSLSSSSQSLRLLSSVVSVSSSISLTVD